MLVVMRLADPRPERLAVDLAAKVETAPAFFNNMPVVIDLEQIQDSDIPFEELITILRNSGLFPVGIRNGSAGQQESALSSGLGTLTRRAPPTAARKAAASAPRGQQAEESAPQQAPSLLVTRPVRSGQQLYARDRDLIVVAPTSAGSELLSDGSIHIYGPLRGRALAGINGDKGARIFCQRLEAELVAIAGRYRTFDELNSELKGKPVQIWLEDDRLRFDTL